MRPRKSKLNRRIDVELLKELTSSKPKFSRIVNSLRGITSHVQRGYLSEKEIAESIAQLTDGRIFEAFVGFGRERCKQYNLSFRNLGSESEEILDTYLQRRGVIDVPMALMHLPRFSRTNPRYRINEPKAVERGEIIYDKPHQKGTLERTVYSVGLFTFVESPSLLFGDELIKDSGRVVLLDDIHVSYIRKYRQDKILGESQ